MAQVNPRTVSQQLRETVVRIGPLGFIAFGGPGVHVLIFRRRFVASADPWVDPTTYADLFALSGALPGPGSTQLLFSIAMVRNGAIMGLLAFFLFSLPGAVGMTLLAIAVTHFPPQLPSLVLALLTGLNASAVGLITCSGYQLSSSTISDPATRIILFLSAAISSSHSAIWLFPVLTVAGGIGTLAVDWEGWKKVDNSIKRRRSGKAREEPVDEVASDAVEDIALEELDMGSTRRESLPDPEKPSPESSPDHSSIDRIPTPPPSPGPSTLRRRHFATSTSSEADPAPSTTPERTPIHCHITIFQSVICLVAFVAMLVSVLVISSTIKNPPRALKLFSNFLTGGTILFGGGPVVIPLLQGYTVTPGWISAQDFLFGFAILQAFPGPNFNFAVFLGALSIRSNPILGALLGYIGMFTPGILLKFALLPAYTKFREQKRVRSVLRGLNAAASGLVWTAVFRLWRVGLLTSSGSSSLEKSGYWAAVAGAAFVGSNSFKVQPYWCIIGGAMLGLIYGGVKGAP